MFGLLTRLRTERLATRGGRLRHSIFGAPERLRFFFLNQFLIFVEIFRGILGFEPAPSGLVGKRVQPLDHQREFHSLSVQGGGPKVTFNRTVGGSPARFRSWLTCSRTASLDTCTAHMHILVSSCHQIAIDRQFIAPLLQAFHVRQ